jgi:hypothetical protein
MHEQLPHHRESTQRGRTEGLDREPPTRDACPVSAEVADHEEERD